MERFFENLLIDFPRLPMTPGTILRHSRQGRPFNIRSFKQSDELLLADFLTRLSSETPLKRYFVGYNSLSQTAIIQELLRLNNVSKVNGSVLVVTSYAGKSEEVVGIGEVTPDKSLYLTAEMALTIRDDYQGEGVGIALANLLVNEASRKGIATLQAETLSYNRPMLRIWAKLGLPYSFQTQHSITTMLAWLKPITSLS
jgi:RimJ/RimL family protein N-acetyltransferase